MTVLIIVAIVVVLAVALIVLYNNLVKLRNMVDNAWSQIDVQMQRRLDLIPNLVETVKGYAAHESGTLEKVTAARSAVSTASTPGEKMAADNILSVTEDKISYMRQSYNDTVMKYNTAIQTFPAVVFAGMFGFKARESFDAVAGAEVAPKVQF